MNSDLRKNVRLNWLGTLFELAHYEIQRKVWLEAEFKDYVGSYTEVVCRYFDDLDLHSGLEQFIAKGFATHIEGEILTEFHFQFKNYRERPEKRGLSDKSILQDVEWFSITQLAKGCWEKLKVIILDKNEVKYMLELENQYLINNST